MSYSRKHLTSLVDIQENRIFQEWPHDKRQVENRSWKLRRTQEWHRYAKHGPRSPSGQVTNCSWSFLDPTQLTVSTRHWHSGCWDKIKPSAAPRLSRSLPSELAWREHVKHKHQCPHTAFWLHVQHKSQGLFSKSPLCWPRSQKERLPRESRGYPPM